MKTDNLPPEIQAQHRRRSQIITLVFLGAALALVFLLAASVGGLHLLPGEPFALPRPAGMQVFAGGSAESELLVIFFRILLALSIIALPIYIIISILTKAGRRRLLVNLLTIAILFALLSALRNMNYGQQDELLNGNMQMELPRMGDASGAKPLPEFSANPSDSTVLAVTLAISLLIAGLTAAAIWYAMTHREKPSSLLALADEAQQAIDTIRAGGPLEETITRCYREMCNVLQKERGIERGSAMTPSEFEQVLIAKGMPARAVHQLTHLFEDIRYGSQPAGASEEQIAIESLSAIAAACRPQRAVA